MRPLARIAVASLVLLSTMVTLSSAQDTDSGRERRGAWVSAGLGTGSFSCDDCPGSVSALAGSVGAGVALSKTVAVGLMLNGWSKEESGATLSMGTAVIGIRAHPWARRGFFVQAGLGVGRIRGEDGGIIEFSQNGGSALLGIGYDIRLSRTVSLTPFYQGFATVTDNLDGTVGMLGIGLTVH